MAGLARHFSAALVAIAMIAAQIMPAWAGCHSARHPATAQSGAIAVMAELAGSGHADMSHVAPSPRHDMLSAAGDGASNDQTPSQTDLCLGNCGCACGLSGAFLIAGLVAIDAPHGVAISRDIVAHDAPRGRSPDGPRRPPRSIG